MRKILFDFDNDIMSGTQPLIIKKYENGKIYLAIIEWKEVDAGIVCRGYKEGENVTLLLKLEEKDYFNRQMIDALKSIKVLDKSPVIQGLEQEMVAAKNHLEDMRSIVFRELEIKKD